MRCLAMDFGGSSVKTAVVDEAGNLFCRKSYPAPLADTDAFVACVKQCCIDIGEKVDGIAVSIPGYVDSGSKTIIGSGVYSHLWGKNIEELLRELAMPVTVENDGNCGALSELWLGSLQGVKDGAVLILGSGIGCGVIVDGKVHHGRNSASGEISYMLLNAGKYGFVNSPIYDVGMIGMTYKMCLAKRLDLAVQDAAETLIGINSMDAQSPLKAGEGAKIKADGKQLFAWLEEQDPEIETIYREFIQNLAALVNNVQMTFAPERIAIGGGLSLQKRVIEDTRRELERFYASMGLTDSVKADVVPCKFLEQTNLLGAAYHFFSQYSDF